VPVFSLGRAHGTVLRRNSLLIIRGEGGRMKLERAKKKKLNGRQNSWGRGSLGESGLEG